MVVSIEKVKNSPLIENLDLANFKEVEGLGNGIPLVFQMKGFNRLERIARRESEEIRGVAGGTDNHRLITEGMIAVIDDLNNLNAIDLNNARYVESLPDPRGLCAGNNGLYIASVDAIRYRDSSSKDERVIRNPWFAFIHSLSLSPDQKKLLVTSPGFDRIIELDTDDYRQSWDWVAWDHGFVTTVTSKKKVVTHLERGEDLSKVIVVTGPESFSGGLGLPPGDRTAFPNSAIYLDDHRILATMFHGGLLVIDKNSGDWTPVLENLSHPHGIRRYKDGFVFADTGRGVCTILDSNLKPRSEISFQNLSVGHEARNDHEWLQQAIPINDDLILGIDSKRAKITILDPSKKIVRSIAYPDNWVLQEVCPIDQSTLNSF